MLAAVHAAIDASEHGRISFHDYMALALYAPGLGYYQAGQARFGNSGDFITAPGLSPLFGACVARQVAEAFPDPGEATVLEIGAGDGALAESVLATLCRLGACPARYLILEPSPDLQARQRARLQGQDWPAGLHIDWLQRWPEQPLHGVVLANEVLDAMPVRRFRRGPDATGLVELAVSRDGDDGLAMAALPADAGLREAVAAIEADLGTALPAGYTSEFNPALAGWFAALAECLASGLVLVSDYGYSRREYYAPERRDGTLLCHFRHRAHEDVFLYPGLQDITASVDFTAAALAAEAAGLRPAGYTTQAGFLLGCGLDEELAAAQQAGEREFLLACQQAKQLTLPSEMGERFRVLALTRGLNTGLRGFRMTALLGRL